MWQKEIVQSLIHSYHSLKIVISLDAEPRKHFFLQYASSSCFRSGAAGRSEAAQVI